MTRAVIVFICILQTFISRTALVRISRQLDNDCVLTNHPKHGFWQVSKSNIAHNPGMSVTNYEFVTVQCDENYKLVGDSVVVCLNGKWNKNIGTCEVLCPPLYGTPKIEVTCVLSNEEIYNCTRAITGTMAKVKCKPFYEDIQFEKQPYMFCVDGKWNKDLPNCVPQCGLKNIQIQPLIINGKAVGKGAYPWQVALYERKKSKKLLICGGSLISQRIIITAAHCITKSSDASLKPKNSYLVAVGKLFRKYDHPEDSSDAQFSTVQEMFIPAFYSGEGRQYAGDIAILITHKQFQLSNSVRTVCMNWALKNFTQELSKAENHRVAYVSGWGLTSETGNASDILRELKIPFINSLDCIDKTLSDTSSFITVDKICGGYVNKSTSVCAGDSGGGLVSENEADKRFYLIGVVSLSSKAPTQAGGCNSQQYGLYTEVAKYISNFIIGKVTLYEDIDKEILFNCSSGDSIIKDQECDGLVNCDDASDETNHCKEVGCPPNYVRCKYGACIHPDNKCDGKQDCKDNSDEDSFSCQETTNSQDTVALHFGGNSEEPCILPSHPENGVWTFIETPNVQTNSYIPGNSIQSGATIQTICDQNYKFDNSNKTIVCKNGVWTPKISGKCLSVCSSIYTTQAMNVTCIFQETRSENCTEAINGTTAQMSCADFYEFAHKPKSGQIKFNCIDGAWDREIPSCSPICGIKSDPIKDHQDFSPWQVIIYTDYLDRFKYTCTGSLISDKLIITSAKCLTDYYGKLYPRTTRVAAGKFYSDYDEPRDDAAQILPVRDIIIPETYRGFNSRFSRNIAVLVIEGIFRLSATVRPVCVQWKATPFTSFQPGQKGVIAGWASTGEKNDATFLPLAGASVSEKKVYVEQSGKCVDAKFQSYDKFCVRFENESIGLCSADEGAGFILRNETDMKYYLGGITSVYGWGENCQNDTEIALTWLDVFVENFVVPKVGQYLNFL